MEASQIPKAWREWWEERAAIMEYEGEMSRPAAEEVAWACLVAMLQQRIRPA
jgi:hypothetical protein